MDNKIDLTLPDGVCAAAAFHYYPPKSDARIVLEKVNSLVHIVDEMLGFIKHLHYGDDDVLRVKNAIDLLKLDIAELLHFSNGRT